MMNCFRIWLSCTLVCIAWVSRVDAQWVQVNNGLASKYINALALAPDVGNGAELLAATSGGGVYRSTDSASHWKLSGLSGYDVVSIVAAGTNLIAGTNGNEGVFICRRDSTWWKPVNAFGLKRFYVTSLLMVADSIRGTTLYAGSAYPISYLDERYPMGSLYRSYDSGESWRWSSRIANELEIWALATTGRGAWIMAGGNQGIYRSSNGGFTWDTCVVWGVETRRIVVTPDPGGPTHERIFVGTMGYGVWSSTDNGTSWRSFVGGGLENYSVWALDVAHVSGRTLVFAGTDGGVFLSTDLGATWKTYNTGLTNLKVRSLLVRGTDLFLGTWGDGVWKRSLSDLTAVENSQPSTPTNFRLYQNYPNPFNSTTCIGFELSASSDVTLEIFDLLGRKVTTLVSERLSAGNFSVKWVANVPSGTYIYRLRAGEFVETKKLILLR